MWLELYFCHQIPADGKTVFEVKDLETNEKYVFAIAAYSSTGKLIGDAIGESTKPILIHPPLSTVTARMYLTQVEGIYTNSFLYSCFPWSSSYLVIYDVKIKHTAHLKTIKHIFCYNGFLKI